MIREMIVGFPRASIGFTKGMELMAACMYPGATPAAMVDAFDDLLVI